mmetsp:Transcript_36915/g.60039  ORF Transcript_36915/g.60039 Transcript_36915/m.60039 type:complete len:143 (-) Transcript_36915:1653-2081(-)
MRGNAHNGVRPLAIHLLHEIPNSQARLLPTEAKQARGQLSWRRQHLLNLDFNQFNCAQKQQQQQKSHAPPYEQPRQLRQQKSPLALATNKLFSTGRLEHNSIDLYRPSDDVPQRSTAAKCTGMLTTNSNLALCMYSHLSKAL